MGFFVDYDSYKIIVAIGEASVNVTRKGSTKPVIVVRSSYEHEQGDTDKTRSRHRPGIKLKKGNVYGDDGLEVFTTDEKGNVKSYDSRKF